jgi:hypothetical protein
MKRFRALLAILIPAASFLLSEAGSRADTITLSLAPASPTGAAVSYVVPTNVVAQVVSSCCYSANGYSSYVTLTINGTTASFLPGVTGNSGGPIVNPPTIVGPATLTLVYTNTGGSPKLSFCTIQTISSYTFTPSSSVVIPNDGGGPVNIILESSTDLINWVAANPGTYSTTSSNRFFRVRAQR